MAGVSNSRIVNGVSENQSAPKFGRRRTAVTEPWVLSTGYHGLTSTIGDSNPTGKVDLSDAITIFNYHFPGRPVTPSCLESADTNNDGTIDISDRIYLLSWLFTGGPDPAPPGPPGGPCGVDSVPSGSAGDLGCQTYTACQ